MSSTEGMTFFDFLSSYPLWVSVGALLVTLTFVGLGVFALIKGLNITEFKGIKRSYGDDRISYVITQHSKLLERAMSISTRHTLVQTQTVIRDQMNMIETYINEITAMMKRAFSDAINEKFKDLVAPIERAERTPDYFRFSKEIRAALQNVISSFRFMMRENHLAEKTDREMDDYVEDRVSFLMQSFEVWIGEEYIGNLVPFEDYMEIYSADLEPEIRRRFSTMLRQARSISVTYEEMIERERAEFEEDRKRFYVEMPLIMKGELDRFS